MRITEIFLSLQGESNTVGIPTVFIRLTGCPLRCQYCDSAYAFEGGQQYTIDSILTEVKRYNVNYVTVTGGEPLAQKTCLDLLKQLCDQDYKVSLETSGALDISGVDPRVIKVMDVKTPGSGEAHRLHQANFEYLTAKDQLKFVICDREDYEWSKNLITNINLLQRCEILFSPSYEQLPAVQLADWIITDRLPVRFQIQLHKTLWGNVPGK